MRPFGSVLVAGLSSVCSTIDGDRSLSACFPATSKPGGGGIGVPGSSVKLDSPLTKKKGFFLGRPERLRLDLQQEN